MQSLSITLIGIYMQYQNRLIRVAVCIPLKYALCKGVSFIASEYALLESLVKTSLT